jgi:hypothetical protein
MAVITIAAQKHAAFVTVRHFSPSEAGGPATLSIMTLRKATFSITKQSIKGSFVALSIKGLFVTRSINDTQHKHHSAKTPLSIATLCHYSECHIPFIVRLNVVMLRVIMFNVVMSTIFMANIMLNAIGPGCSLPELNPLQ